MSSYVLFYSSNYTIWAENTLKDAGVECKMVSVPREISSDCGYCLKISSDKKDEIEEILRKKHIPIEGIVEL